PCSPLKLLRMAPWVPTEKLSYLLCDNPAAFGVTMSTSGTPLGAAPTLGWLATGAVVLAEIDWALATIGWNISRPLSSSARDWWAKRMSRRARPSPASMPHFAVAGLRRTIILLMARLPVLDFCDSSIPP